MYMAIEEFCPIEQGAGIPGTALSNTKRSDLLWNLRKVKTALQILDGLSTQ